MTDESATEEPGFVGTKVSLGAAETEPLAVGAADGGAAEVFLRIAKGQPTPPELAALVAVLAAMNADARAATETRATAEALLGADRSAWAAPYATLRRPHLPGPGAWRASGLPR